MAEHLHKTQGQRENAVLTDYDLARKFFQWEDARRLLGAAPGDPGLNIGYVTVDCHADGDRRDTVALRCAAANLPTRPSRCPASTTRAPSRSSA